MQRKDQVKRLTQPPNRTTSLIVNILQTTICILIGLLLGAMIGLLIAKKRKDSKSQSEDYPKWHILEEVLDMEIKMDDRILIKFIDTNKERTTLILKVYDKNAGSQNFTATYYCVQSKSSRFRVSPGNYIIKIDADEIIRLVEFHWTPSGPVITNQRK